MHLYTYGFDAVQLRLMSFKATQTAALLDLAGRAHGFGFGDGLDVPVMPCVLSDCFARS